MNLLVKIHRKDSRTIVAVCDKGLIGKVFEENGKQLDLSGDFYNGKEMDATELGDLIRNADGVNMVGEEAVKLGIEEGIIEKEDIMHVKGIPHAQAALIQEN